jgi:3D (Asp-Asp-Asp) domain-containing protein
MRWGAPAFAVASTIALSACAPRVRPATQPPAHPRASAFTATAYCTGHVTAAGTAPTRQTVAADPAVLPLGTRISISGLGGRYNGQYVVMDTGSRIRGHRIDLFMRDCREAVRFGRRSARVTVID